MKYPNVTNTIYTEWPKISTAVIKLAKEKKIKIEDLQMENIDVSLLSIKLLPWLFQPITIRNTLKKINSRPSRIEMQESFFLNLQTSEELWRKIEQKRNSSYKFPKRIQPFIACIGALHSCDAFYVVMDNGKYQCNNILTAVDIAFKIISALNFTYPPECKAVWQTINHFVYKIEEPLEPSASAVVSELIRVIKSN